MGNTVAESENDNINMDNTVAESENDNINMDNTVAESEKRQHKHGQYSSRVRE